jgi:putative DNA modification/repair radical SAM protein
MISLTLERRLAMLAESAKYDVSCSSSGSSRRGAPGGVGTASPSGICHTWTADGRCISLFKILLSNSCIFDCAYCVNRSSNPVPRTSFTPEEIVDLTMSFYRRNYIEGLFLSTGVVVSPDYTMELLIRTARTLRLREKFGGYIHLKIVPGADGLLVEEAGRYADRVSVNIELPSRHSLRLLAPDKPQESILGPMRQLSALIDNSRRERRHSRKAPSFAPAGQSTQLVVGATPETDRDIISLAERLYSSYGMRRVYYSAFVPVSTDRRLSAPAPPPLLREHRLYQADWLLRFYEFNSEELLDEARPALDLTLDPKSDWALRHPEFFPVEVNRADYRELLRVPGIGVRSARRILRARRVCRLREEELKRLGVVLKRARYFITAEGRFLGEIGPDSPELQARLAEPGRRKSSPQLELFPTEGDATGVFSGEL